MNLIWKVLSWEIPIFNSIKLAQNNKTERTNKKPVKTILANLLLEANNGSSRRAQAKLVQYILSTHQK